MTVQALIDKLRDDLPLDAEVMIEVIDRSGISHFGKLEEVFETSDGYVNLQHI